MKTFEGYFKCPICGNINPIPWLIKEDQNVTICFEPEGIKKMKFFCECGAEWEFGIMEQEKLEEQRKIKWVIRKGKKVRKVFCPPGFKAVDRRCVRMSAQERLKRKRAARLRKNKIRSKLNLILRKRRLSLKKRKMFGLDK